MKREYQTIGEHNILWHLFENKQHLVFGFLEVFLQFITKKGPFWCPSLSKNALDMLDISNQSVLFCANQLGS